MGGGARVSAPAARLRRSARAAWVPVAARPPERPRIPQPPPNSPADGGHVCAPPPLMIGRH